jgi:hypothetical protein
MEETTFPTVLPMGALRQLGLFVTKKDSDLGRASLAAWQLVGFGLGRYFGDVRFMLGDSAPIPTDVNLDVVMTQIEASGAIPDWFWPLALKIIDRLVDKYLPAK